MTKIFYADQKTQEKQTKNSSISSESQNPSESRPVHAGTSWIDAMGYVFWFLRQWMRFRFYRSYNLIPLPLREGIAGALGQLFLGFSKINRLKVETAFQVLYPHLQSRKIIKRLYFAHCAYMGKLYFDFLSGLPKNVDLPVSQFIKFENLEILKRELGRNKGVIIPTTHLGQLVHVILALAKLPEKIPVATVVYTPHLVTYQLSNREGFDHVYLYASTKFQKISKYLVDHLRRNHIVVLYFDFGTPRQLRVPMWPEKYPYLIHTPQSVINLHIKTGASILPCINTPNGYIFYSKLTFCENKSLMEISAEIKDHPPKIIHGQLSMEINRLLYPTICRFAHTWEEIPDLATSRLADELIIPEGCSLTQCLELIVEKLRDIISNSYEPRRNDSWILKSCERSEDLIKHYHKLLNQAQIRVQTAEKTNLSWMNTLNECKILTRLMFKNLNSPEFTGLRNSLQNIWQDMEAKFYTSSE